MKKKIPHFIIHHTLISCKHPVFKALRAIFFFLILAVNAKAIEVTPTGNEQDIRITGIVRDNKGEPLAGVTVKIKNSTDAVATTKEGKFAINVLSREAVLVFSFLGFETQEIKIGEQTSLNISLKSTSSNLNEIVVIGYGTAKKKDLTGSVSSIQAKELESKQFSNIQETLQGRVAGLQLTTGDASPGSSPTIRIRGTGSLGTSSDPLFVIDGYPSNEDLSSINPGDIASIDILKDASATAIYGSRGANGVILITTKKGIAGQYKIDAEAYQGVASTTNRLKLMNAREYAEYRNEVVQNTTPGSKPFASPALLDYYSAHNTDWQDALYRNAPLTNVNVSMSGGDDKSRFLLSGNYFSQDGIILNTGFKRGSLRFNFDRTISSKLKFNLTSTLTKTYNNRTLVNTSGGTAGGVVINVLRMNPTIAVYDANGKFTYKNTIQSDDASDPNATIELNGNPVAFATKNVDDNNVLRGQINTSLNYQITPELQFRTFFGVEYLANWRNTYTPNDLFEQAFFNGSASKTTNIRNNWITENYVTYNKNFNDQNSINIVAGYSYQYFKQESTLASSTNYFTNLFSYNNLSTGVSQTDNSSASQNTLQSFFPAGKPYNYIATPTSRPYCGKYKDPLIQTVANDRTNCIILRYADVLLMRSEALNRLNPGDPQKYAGIDAVRARAGLSAKPLARDLSQADFETAIMNERGWEFAFEGKRREDLIRFGKLVSVMTTDGKPGLTDKINYFPVPQTEIDLNNNLLPQNSGY